MPSKSRIDLLNADNGLPLSGFHLDDHYAPHSDGEGGLEVDEKQLFHAKLWRGDDRLAVVGLDGTKVFGSIAPRVWTERDTFFPGDEIRVYGGFGFACTVELTRFGSCKVVLGSADLASDEVEPILVASAVVGFPLQQPKAAFTLSESALPGLYGLVVRHSGGRIEQIHPIVVATLELNRNVPTVIANVLTWHAYNFYGGMSRYKLAASSRQTERALRSPANLARLVPRGLREPMGKAFPVVRRKLATRTGHRRVSTIRPMNSPGLRSNSAEEPFLDHLAGSEWRLLAWLEQRDIGYNMSTDRDIRLLNPGNTSGVILNSHSEYWTASGANHLADLVADGVGLANLSGNSLYSEVVDCGTSLSFAPHPFTAAKKVDRPRSIQLTATTLRHLHNYCAPLEASAQLATSGLSNLEAGKIFGSASLNCGTPGSRGGINGNIPGNGSKALIGNGAAGWEVDGGDVPPGFQVIARAGAPLSEATILHRPRGEAGPVLCANSISFVGSLLIDATTSEITERFIASMRPITGA